jgi:diguanylate cyclase (GGDEF)-like protein/PAS domain S-box-containing protein
MGQLDIRASDNLAVLSQYVDESERLKALRDLDILDTPPEGELDDLVQLAAEVCGTPISSVNLVDEARVWIKASIGLEIGEARREDSFCTHTIQGDDLLIIEDAELDARFQANPNVTTVPGVRFYAGMPLSTRTGHAVGALCVVDTIPRTLKQSQLQALKVLATQVMVRMELRVQRRELEAALEAKEAALAEKVVIEQGLKESEALFRTFMNLSPFASYIKDVDGRMVYYNENLAKRFGVTQEEWLGRTDAEIWPAELAATFRRNDLIAFQSGGTTEVVDHTRVADGSIVCWRSIKFPYRDSKGDMLLAGISVDITEELRWKNELEDANVLLLKLATTDGLTGLKNRRAFEDRLHKEFELLKRSGRQLSVLMIDIDNFKRRNDTWGHAAGDEVLRKVGAILNSTIRVTDTAARYGGEEFVILMPETGGERAFGLAERLRSRMAEEEWEHSSVTLSFGIATADATMLHSDHLMKAADSAMYGAKRAGKDRIRMGAEQAEDALVGGTA